MYLQRKVWSKIKVERRFQKHQGYESLSSISIKCPKFILEL